MGAEGLEIHLADQLSERFERFFWHRLRWRAVAPAIAADRSVKVLDVGAGAGILGRFVRRRRPRASYHFFEPLPRMVEHLTDLFGAEANAALLPDYHDMDVVLALDVMEHLPDDDAFLREIHGKMRRGALFCCTVPAGAYLWSEWDRGMGHLRRYSRQGLKACLTRAGFRVGRCRYLFPELIPLGLVRKLSCKKGETEFPHLADWINGAFFQVGRISQVTLSAWLPLGTSLVAFAERV